MNDIEELRLKCKKKQLGLTLKDFRVMYYLWNDPSISRYKIKQELKHSDSTLVKINEFINNWIKEYKPKLDDDGFLEEILEAYLNRG